MDPSCSGSGIASRMDKFVDEEQETDAKKVCILSIFFFIRILSSQKSLFNKHQVAREKQGLWQLWFKDAIVQTAFSVPR